MSLMNTYTGRKCDPMNMKADDVALEDIAHALSMLCRGCGHIRWFYPVAQHCVNCAEEAAARGWPDRLVLACLLHDAGEAYLSDVISPVKPFLNNYVEIEEKLMKAVWEKFGLGDLTEDEEQKWRQIDHEVMNNELIAMMPGEEERAAVRLSSEPDLQEYPHGVIEKRYLEKARLLLEKIGKKTG